MFPNTTSVPLCYNWIEFDSDVDDTDHFLIGDPWPPWTSYLYWYDTIVYSWSTDPNAGEWQGDTSGSQALWQAPPCIGTVVVRLDVDDLPDEALGACPCENEDNRNDDPNWYEIAIEVVLPSNCNQGEPSLVLDTNLVTFTGAQCASISGCGYFAPLYLYLDDLGISIDITAVYKDCTWQWQVEASIDVEMGMCPDVIDIGDGNDPDLTPDNYCAIVTSMREQAGCTEHDGHEYSSHACLMVHEANHLDYYQRRIQDPLVLSQIEEDDLFPITIDCADSSTTSCQAVVGANYERIKSAIVYEYRGAYNDAIRWSEPGAIDAARACFNALADSICAYASMQGWPSCNACPP